jgi:hypothetical protein
MPLKVGFGFGTGKVRHAEQSQHLNTHARKEMLSGHKTAMFIASPFLLFSMPFVISGFRVPGQFEDHVRPKAPTRSR